MGGDMAMSKVIDSLAGARKRKKIDQRTRRNGMKGAGEKGEETIMHIYIHAKSNGQLR